MPCNDSLCRIGALLLAFLVYPLAEMCLAVADLLRVVFSIAGDNRVSVDVGHWTSQHEVISDGRHRAFRVEGAQEITVCEVAFCGNMVP